MSPLEQQVIEVGSGEGSEFATVAVAVGLGQEVALVEEMCTKLARRSQLLPALGE